MSSSTNIESSNPAEAIDPIEAIKAKILNADSEVPLVNNTSGWKLLVEFEVVTKAEVITYTNHISESTSATQGK